MLLIENSLHRGFGRVRQMRITVGYRVLAHMRRQGLARPKFSRVAHIFGFGASQMHDPSFSSAVDDRLLGPMIEVFEAGFDPHLQGLVETMINSHPTQIGRASCRVRV